MNSFVVRWHALTNDTTFYVKVVGIRTGYVKLRNNRICNGVNIKNHILWAILAVVTFILHMVAGIYSDFMYWLAEYIWAISVLFSVLCIYSGAITAAKTMSDRRGAAVASAVIGTAVLLGLLFSASYWLFISSDEGLGTLTSLYSSLS